MSQKKGWIGGNIEYRLSFDFGKTKEENFRYPPFPLFYLFCFTIFGCTNLSLLMSSFSYFKNTRTWVISFTRHCNEWIWSKKTTCALKHVKYCHLSVWPFGLKCSEIHKNSCVLSTIIVLLIFHGNFDERVCIRFWD